MSEGNMILLAIGGGLLLLVGFLLVMYYVRRGVHAQEKLADCLHRFVELEEADRSHNYMRETALQHKLYKQFQRENPETAELPSKQRHEKFREWSEAHA